MSQLQNISYDLGPLPPPLQSYQNNAVLGSLQFADGTTFSTSSLEPGYASIFGDSGTNSYPATLIVTNSYTNEVVKFSQPCSTIQTNTNNSNISAIVTGDTFIDVYSDGLHCTPVGPAGVQRNLLISTVPNEQTKNMSFYIEIFLVILLFILVLYSLRK